MSRSTRQPARPAHALLTGVPLAGALATAALALAACGPVTSNAGSGSSAGTSAPAAGSASGGAPAGSGSSAPGQQPGGRHAASQALCASPGSVTHVVIAKLGAGGPVIAIAPAAPAATTALTTAATRPVGPAVTTASAGRAAATSAADPARAARTTAAGLSVRAVTAAASTRSVVRGAAQAQQLAKLLCALPAMSGSPVHCPLETTTGYRIVFTAPGRVLPPVTVQASGCQRVSGAGNVRTSAGHPAVLKMLASLAGPVPLPGAGHLPGSSVSTGHFHPIDA